MKKEQHYFKAEDIEGHSERLEEGILVKYEGILYKVLKDTDNTGCSKCDMCDAETGQLNCNMLPCANVRSNFIYKREEEAEEAKAEELKQIIVYAVRDKDCKLYLFWHKPRKAIEQGMWVAQKGSTVEVNDDAYPQLAHVSWEDKEAAKCSLQLEFIN